MDGLTGFVVSRNAGTDVRTYYYRKNLQKDITHIQDGDGNVKARYVYDAWGNHKVLDANGTENNDPDFIGNVNPFRYRSYYFDNETRLYYLMSRYYDPETGRFVNADSVDVALNMGRDCINGLNLYSYCLNNPVNMTDSTGFFFDLIADIAFIAWGAKDVMDEPGDWTNWASLAIDIGFAVVPFVPNVPKVIKVIDKIDNAADVADLIKPLKLGVDFLSNTTMIGRNMTRVIDVAKKIGILDNIYKEWKGYYMDITKYPKILVDRISAAHNAVWLLGKLRRGNSVIDIGMMAEHTGRGLWYGAERATLALWQTRNIWKFAIHYSKDPPSDPPIGLIGGPMDPRRTLRPLE